MRASRKLRLQVAVQSGLFGALLLALIMLLAYAAGEYRQEWDVTRNGRNTVSPATLDVLRGLEGPLTVTAYALASDASGTKLHRVIEERFAPYRRAKPDLQLTFVDPREEPQRAERAQVRTPNELVVEYRGRKEHLPVNEFNEQSFATLLTRLLRGTASMVFTIDGHGERSLEGGGNRDLGEFGRQLQQRGMRFQSLNLALVPAVPDDAALLILAAPQITLQPAEVEKLERFIERGGNLLWLIDPAPLAGLEPLAERFNLVLTPGTVVDPALRRSSGPPVFAAASGYGPHPITRGFRYLTVFPYARQIDAADSTQWRLTPLVEVAPRGWVEMGALDGEPTFDKTRDLPGPVVVAFAFERSVGEKQQRVVVVGSGSFLSNVHLGTAGNLQFGTAVVEWLTAADHLVALEARPAADARIDIGEVTLYAIALGFLLVLPLAFVAAGFAIWWRRRRAA